MMLISSLYNIVDKAFVGNYVGQLGITATTVCHPAVRIIDAFAMLVGAGGSTLLALRLGEGRSQDAEPILNNSFLLLILENIVLIALGYAFTEPLLRLFGAGDQVMPYAVTYIRVVLIGAFFNSTANGFGMFVRVDGSPRRMMLCSVTGCILNIILDPIAIYVLGLGHCRCRRCHRLFSDRLRPYGHPLFHPQPQKYHETPVPSVPAGQNYNTENRRIGLLLLPPAVHR